MVITKYRITPFWKGTEAAPDNYKFIREVKIFGIVLCFLSKIK